MYKLQYIVLTLLLLGFSLFSRSFAYLHVKIAEIPLYVTEVVLIVSIVAIMLSKLVAGKMTYPRIPLTRGFVILYSVALISFIIGIFSYKDKVFVLRHSALFYYSILYFLVPLVFNNLKRIERLFKLFFITCIVTPFGAFLPTFPDGYGVGNFSYLYLSFAIIFEILYVRYLKKKIYQFIFFLIIILQLSSIFIGECRAAWVALAGTFLFLYFLDNTIRAKIKKALSIVVFFILILIPSFIVLKPARFKSVIQEILTLNPFRFLNFDPNETETSVSINNMRWRIYVWKDMLKEISEKPILGWSFGKKFVPPTIKALGWGGSWREEDKGFQDPHNSFLSILYRTGIIGFGLFIIIITKFIKRTIRFLNLINNNKKIKMYITALLACIIDILIISLLLVVLEGPFMGSFLWVAMGLIVALERIYKKSMPVQQEANT